MFSFFSTIFEFVLDTFHYYYETPLVKRITKRGLMGNVIDKTLEYYISGIDISPLDNEYFVKYNHKNKDYILVCDKDKLEEAIKFIKRRDSSPQVDKIMVASEEISQQFKNITEKLKMFAGPEEDFYINTDFHVKKKYITDNNLYILTKDFKRYVFTDEEVKLIL